MVLFAQQPDGGLILLPSGNLAIENSDLVIALAARYRLPALYPYRFIPMAGGLMSYDPDVKELCRGAASYVGPHSPRRQAWRASCASPDEIST